MRSAASRRVETKSLLFSQRTYACAQQYAGIINSYPDRRTDRRPSRRTCALPSVAVCRLHAPERRRYAATKKHFSPPRRLTTFRIADSEQSRDWV